MKKTLTKIYPALSIILLLVIVFVPVYANAAGGTIVEKIAFEGINFFLAGLGNAILTLVSWLLAAVGVLLNVAMNTTLGIGRYIDRIQAITEVWIVIRNLSSIFIIFLLMYSSIATILGAGTTKLKALVMNIVIAGLLINFSLFFAKVLIDASNLVSLQFYRAIAPNTENSTSSFDAFYKGGISDVFMSSLKIPQIYQNTKSIQSQTDAGLSVFIATIGGVIMMVTAGFSFLAVSIALIARTGILLFLLALSPFYFVGIIFPQIKKEVSDPIWDMFKNQLLFMPVYLFLMYIALRLISSPGFKAIFNNSPTAIPSGEGPLGATSIGVIIQYVIAIIFINAPLVAALKFGAVGASWAPQAGGISKWIGKSAWQNTGSRLASKVAESEIAKEIASRTGRTGQLALTGMRTAASDYNKKLDAQVSSRTKFADSLDHDKRAVQALEAQKRQLDILKNAKGTKPLTPGELATLRSQYGATVNSVQDAKDIVEKRIMNKKSARKEQYAHNINQPTLYTMRARKDKVAAAKIQIPILKEHLTELKDSLRDTKYDIKSLTAAITNNRADPARGILNAGDPTTAQAKKLQNLVIDEAKHLSSIDSVHSQIDQLELIS